MNDTQWKVRAVRKSEGGPVKRHSRGTAAKLVASGEYVYTDGGPDDSANVVQKQRINKIPSPNIEADSFGTLFRPQNDTPSKSPRAKKDMNSLTESEKNMLKQKAVLASSSASITPDKGIDALKNAIQRSREARAKAADLSR